MLHFTVSSFYDGVVASQQAMTSIELHPQRFPKSTVFLAERWLDGFRVSTLPIRVGNHRVQAKTNGPAGFFHFFRCGKTFRRQRRAMLPFRANFFRIDGPGENDLRCRWEFQGMLNLV